MQTMQPIRMNNGRRRNDSVTSTRSAYERNTPGGVTLRRTLRTISCVTGFLLLSFALEAQSSVAIGRIDDGLAQTRWGMSKREVAAARRPARSPDARVLCS
jgi:hypothetical protein